MNASEYATLVFYWFWEPHPERMDEILSMFENSCGSQTEKRILPMVGAVLAFEELEPFKKPIWRANHPDLYRAIEKAMQRPKDDKFWSDFLLAQWFILRRDDLILQILERAGRWGEKDSYTVAMINQACQNHGGFRAAAERLKLPVTVCLDSPTNSLVQ
jgi:hypothetical protein